MEGSHSSVDDEWIKSSPVEVGGMTLLREARHEPPTCACNPESTCFLSLSPAAG